MIVMNQKATRKDSLFEPVRQREKIFHGRYLDLQIIHVELPNGQKAQREIVQVKNAVAILPVDESGMVHLVRQHRPAISRTILEVPAGLMNEKESVEVAAQRECEEETGYYPTQVQKLLTYAHAEGYSTGWITLFLGTRLEKRKASSLDKTEFVEQVRIEYRELIRLVERNQIVDSKTILSVLLARTFLKIEEPRSPSGARLRKYIRS